MSSDNQYTALGPAIIGFQTDATRIDRGADIFGNEFGIRGASANGAGVIGESENQVGVEGRGETGIVGHGLRGPGVEGIGGNFFGREPEAGIIGQGGRRRPDRPEEARSLHGPGVVGLGGSRSRELSDADEIAGSVGVFGQGAEGEAERRPGAGVVGRGGAISGGAVAPGVVGLTRSALDLGVMEPRDTGVFGRGATGVTGQGTTGPGVHGVGGPGGLVGEASPETLQAGVVGESGSALAPGNGGIIHGAGVIGLAGDLRPLSFAETGETGVYGAGKTGVKGVGSEGRGGVFVSERSAQVQLIPTRGPRIVEQATFIPTVATEPGRLGPPLPRAGRGGDLMTISDDQGQCTLWFCVHDGTGNSPARWTQVLLGPAFDGRG